MTVHLLLLRGRSFLIPSRRELINGRRLESSSLRPHLVGGALFAVKWGSWCTSVSLRTRNVSNFFTYHIILCLSPFNSVPNHLIIIKVTSTGYNLQCVCCHINDFDNTLITIIFYMELTYNCSYHFLRYKFQYCIVQ